jgi:uncharacterized membrane protein
MSYTRSDMFSFLAWNLFLAWMPLISAFVAYTLYQKPRGLFRLLAALVCIVVWLLFLPNAPYLITDLIHLKPRMEMVFWFDLTMLIAYAVTGLLCGLVSLYWMQQVVYKLAGTIASWLFVFGVMGLCSFGVYLGRFLRWNSWDIVGDPLGLMADIWYIVRHPIANYRIYVFSVLFSLFLLAAYIMLNTFTRLPQSTTEE